MKRLLAQIKKEFLQIIRNKIMIRIIVAMPILQLVILVNAANFDIKSVSLAVIDRDNSTLSTKLTAKLQSSDYFILRDFTTSKEEAMEGLASDKTDVLLEIPAKFEESIYRNENPRLAITVNAINGMKAGIVSSYMSNIIADFAAEQAVKIGVNREPRKIEVTYSQWFNPGMDYKSLMLPGVLAILITLISVLLSALNIVREKEMGTIEQLNVTPIKKWQFIVGKLFPFWVIGLFMLTLGLLVSVILFNLHIVGSLWLLYGVVSIYLVAVLGLGFLISTISQTQTQAMFVTLFFAITFILLSGLFTPTDSMPEWARAINTINPVAYLVQIIRLVVLKGSSIIDIMRPLVAIIIFGIVVNLMVMWRYKKVN